MDGTSLITLSGLLYYIYNRFAVTFLMCFLGVIIGKVLNIFSANTIKLVPIKALHMALQSALVTVIMCALQDYIEIKSFNTYVLICVFLGMWSPIVMKILTNVKILSKFVVNISKKVKDPIISAVGDTINQIETENDDDTNCKDDKSEKKEEEGG